MNASMGSRFRLDLVGLGIFVLALSARILHILASRESPLFDHLVIDSVDFDARAMEFLRGGWPEEGAFYQAPLYPLFLSAVYWIFGHDLLAVRVVQAVLGSFSAVLVYLIGRRCAGKAPGAVAAVLYSLYAMSIHFDSEILRPALVVFLSLLSVHLLLRAREGRGVATWAAVGLILGLASITRPTLLVFMPLAFVWAVFRGGRARDGSGRAAGKTSHRSLQSSPVLLRAAVLAACTLVPVVAVTSVNYAKSRSFVPISYNGGINFYIGNNPEYDRTVGIRPGIRWDLLTAEPPADRRTDPAGWSRYYYRKAMDLALSNPRGYLALLAKKFVLFWNGHEIERNASFDNVAAYSPFVAHRLMSFRWMAPLAIVGMILAWRRRTAMGLPALLLISQIGATVAFFVCARYRMTSVPVLCMFAGYAAVVLVDMTRRRAPAVLLYVALGILAAVAVNVDAYGISKQRYSRPDYELALVLRREGRTDEAGRLFERASRADPDDPDPLFQTGVHLAGRGSYNEAASYFLAAARLEPGYARSWFNLGLMLSRSGDTAPAVDAYERALAAQPAYWEASMGLGDALIGQQRYGEAVGAFQRSMELARGRRELAVSTMSLGRAQAMTGEYETALGNFDKALLLSPDSVDARLAKARVLIVLERPDEAAQEARLAARADSSDARVKAIMRELGLEE